MAHEINLYAGVFGTIIWVRQNADTSPDPVSDGFCMGHYTGDRHQLREALISGEKITLFGTDRVTVERVAP